jgi:hypothetical protein
MRRDAAPRSRREAFSSVAAKRFADIKNRAFVESERCHQRCNPANDDDDRPDVVPLEAPAPVREAVHLFQCGTSTRVRMTIEPIVPAMM